jgi:hypothetical protein
MCVGEILDKVKTRYDGIMGQKDPMKFYREIIV